jgi:hypothetical protein
MHGHRLNVIPAHESPKLIHRLPGPGGKRMFKVEKSTFRSLIVSHSHTEPYTLNRPLELGLVNLRLPEVPERAKEGALGAEPNAQWLVAAQHLHHLLLDRRLAKVPSTARDLVDMVDVQAPASPKPLCTSFFGNSSLAEQLTEVILAGMDGLLPIMNSSLAQHIDRRYLAELQQPNLTVV